ncbi:unnamed protein product [Didymodactylos carnosus]|nr:unnamed protein product [Didymodactylos carnosus]CAF3734697.1 unnamed protein product [Didymodactylos carnosus]
MSDDEVQSFSADYAKSDLAKCHGKNCANEISKGTLRLARLIPNPFIPTSSTHGDQLMPQYYHVQCFMNYLRSGSEKKKRVANVSNDIQGFEELKKKDQDYLKRLFASEQQVNKKLESSTAQTTYLEAHTDDDDKFWQITIDNKTTKTKYGILGEDDSEAIILIKDFSTNQEAQKYVDKKVQEKVKRGYTIEKQTGTVGTKRKRGASNVRKTPDKRQKLANTKTTATNTKKRSSNKT